MLPTDGPQQIHEPFFTQPESKTVLACNTFHCGRVERTGILGVQCSGFYLQ
jgi:hypothetical protein